MTRPRDPLGYRLRFAALAAVVRPTLNLFMSKGWAGAEHLPRNGGIICANHMTEIDFLVIGHYLYAHGILSHFVAKDALFKTPVVGSLMRQLGHIPVNRRSAGQGWLAPARRIIERGGVVVVYPEGTLTRDPDLWPMRGRLGSARLSLETQAPTVPLGHWGAHHVLPRYARKPDLFPRKHVEIAAGPPVDLTDLTGHSLDRETLETATSRTIAAITAIVARLRNETPPAVPFDPGVREGRGL